MREALGEHVFSRFIEAKRAEWDEYRTQVTELGAGSLPRGVLSYRSRRNTKEGGRRAALFFHSVLS